MPLPIRAGDVPGVQLRVRRSLALSRGEAWRWLVDPRRLEVWLADRAEIEPGLGGGLRLERKGAAGEPAVVETGRTERFAAGREWVLEFRKEDPAWERATRLELTLHEAGDGCDLDVFQTGFQHLALSACLTIWEEYRRRWREALARLEEKARPPGG